MRHTRKSRFDHAAYSVKSAGDHAWGRRPATDLRFFLPLAEAKRQRDTHPTNKTAPYVDCHAWHFTPSSFTLAVVELSALGELDFRIDRAFPTEEFEFYVTLRQGREQLGAERLESRRLELLRAVLLEVREQADLLADNAPNSHEQSEVPVDVTLKSRAARSPSRASEVASKVRSHVRARTRLRHAANAARRRLTR
jgi:hypothetical protein